jgi:hypothetical protein
MPSGQLFDKQTIWCGIIHDITARKTAEEENNRLIQQLQLAITDIETLEGILPICCHCKKIRNDQGDWEQMEVYVSRRSKADFSHGVCPDCLEIHYPEYRCVEE